MVVHISYGMVLVTNSFSCIKREMASSQRNDLIRGKYIPIKSMLSISLFRTLKWIRSKKKEQGLTVHRSGVGDK